METIELVGGPVDGEIRVWNGGDFLRVSLMTDTPVFGPHATVPKGDVPFEMHDYRRSTNSRRYFVHQP